MKGNYLKNLLNFRKLTRDLRKFVKEDFYKKDGSLRKRGHNGNFCYFPIYRQRFEPIKTSIEICDLLGIEYLEKWKPTFFNWVTKLEDPLRLETYGEFKTTFKVVQKFLYVEEQIEEAISLLAPSEIDRLNEAIHCFLEGCYYSSIAMSVSAIEFRLLSLMISISPDSKLEELTLGQLIREYLDNRQKYGRVIPKKHEPLLEHCNTYRIFSVHPKKERISKPVASSILNMTFLFLLDKKLIKKVKQKGKAIVD